MPRWSSYPDHLGDPSQQLPEPFGPGVVIYLVVVAIDVPSTMRVLSSRVHGREMYIAEASAGKSMR